jgi:hypothetical protein
MGSRPLSDSLLAVPHRFIEMSEVGGYFVVAGGKLSGLRRGDRTRMPSTDRRWIAALANMPPQTQNTHFNHSSYITIYGDLRIS